MEINPSKTNEAHTIQTIDSTPTLNPPDASQVYDLDVDVSAIHQENPDEVLHTLIDSPQRRNNITFEEVSSPRSNNC